MQRKLHSTRSSSTGAVQETKHSLCEGKAASKWQTIRHLMGAGMIFSMTILFCSVATATPAPGTYEKLQANAEEVLRVRIINVGREASERIDPRSYTVQARVLAVCQLCDSARHEKKLFCQSATGDEVLDRTDLSECPQ